MNTGLKPLALLITFVLCISGCVYRSSQSAPSDPPAPAVLTSLRIALASASPMVGQSDQIKVTGLDQKGQTIQIDVALAYSSSNTTVATVSSGGLIQALAVGSSTITVSAPTVTPATVTVAVAPDSPALKTITISPMTATVQVGQMQAYTAQGYDQYGNPFAVQNFTYASQGTAILSGNSLQALSVGSATITASSGGVTSRAATLTVVQIPPTLKSITLSASQTSLSIGGTAILTAIGADQYGNPFSFPPTFTLSGSAVSVSGTTVTGAAQGSARITASYGSVTSNPISFSVALASQTVSFPTPASQAALTNEGLTATASSGLSLTYSTFTPTICSVSSATVSLLTAGTCTLTATQPGNFTYGAASTTVSFLVSLASQTINITFAPSVVALADFTFTGTATSGLSVTLTSLTPSVCSTTQAFTAGTCSIQATQPGNNVYAAAPAKAGTFTVTLAPQTITFPAPTSAQRFTVSATSTSGLPVTFSTTSVACIVNGTTVTEVSAGDCLIEADEAGNNVYAAANPVTQDITIGQVMTAISVTPAAITVNPGASTAFTATGYDQFNQPMLTAPTFTWAVDNMTVATINGTGVATGAVLPTTATANITASANGVTSSPAQMTVNGQVLTGVTLSPDGQTIAAPSGALQYSVTELDQSGLPMSQFVSCTYSSDNTAAATLDGNGLATSQNATPNVLTTDISATCGGLTTNSVTLTVNPQVRFAATLVATPNPASVMQTQSTSVLITAYDEYGQVFSTPQIDIDSYSSSVISASALNSAEGNQILVTGVAIGSTTVVVHIDTDDSVSTSFTVNVTPCLPVVCYTPVLTTITVTAESTSIEYQGAQAFSAQGFDQKGGGFKTTFIWTSSNTSVLTVDANGNATAVGPGTATVQATSGGVTGTSPTITVVPAVPAPIRITTTFPRVAVTRQPAVPTPTNSNPTSARAQVIVINGTGFVSGAIVSFGSDATPAHTTFKSSTELLVTVPAADLNVSSDITVPIFVTNPLQPGAVAQAVSNSVSFLITTQAMVSITFDDGYQSAYDNGIPIFTSAGLQVTDYIIAGTYSGLTRSDGYPYGWSNNNCPTASYPLPLTSTQLSPTYGCLVGVGQSGFVSWAEVQTLASTTGVEIGAHTRSHNALSVLSAADQVGEIQGAKADLAAALPGVPIRTMAYPYGDYGCLTANTISTTCAPVAGNGTGSTAQTVGTEVVAAGFKGARSSDMGYEGDTSGNPAANLPIYLASFAGDSTAGDAGTAAQLEAIVNTAVTKHAWLIFLFHRVDDPCSIEPGPYNNPSTVQCTGTQVPNPISIDSVALQGLANYLVANGIRTVTISEGLAIEGLNAQYQTLLFPTE